MRRALASLFLSLLGLACDEAEGPPDGALDGGVAEDASSEPDAGVSYLSALRSNADLASLEGDAGEVKYLVRTGDAGPYQPLPEPCVFQDTTRYPFHIEFLRSLSGLESLSFQEYEALVLERATRVWWAGGLKLFPSTTHPLTGLPGVLAYTMYAESVPGALLFEDVLELSSSLRACVPFAGDELAFLPTDSFQLGLARARQSDFEAAGVAVLLGSR